jgi:AhpD family alkylhydroperoxidase
MKLNIHIRELIAVGTAIGANCHNCLQYHVTKAREQNVPDDEIAEAIEVGKAVRKGAQGSMDKLANELLRVRPATLAQATSDCGCGSMGAESPMAK